MLDKLQQQCLAKRSSALRAEAAELARADYKARKGGSKLRLSELFGCVLLNADHRSYYRM